MDLRQSAPEVLAYSDDAVRVWAGAGGEEEVGSLSEKLSLAGARACGDRDVSVKFLHRGERVRFEREPVGGHPLGGRCHAATARV